MNTLGNIDVSGATKVYESSSLMRILTDLNSTNDPAEGLIARGFIDRAVVSCIDDVKLLVSGVLEALEAELPLGGKVRVVSEVKALFTRRVKNLLG